jgi:transcriptional regulator with XRE-family HTH domain
MGLKELRIVAGLTQCDVAKQCGVDRSRLSLAENEYSKLRPEEEATVRNLLLRHIEIKAGQCKGVLSGRHAVAV